MIFPFGAEGIFEENENEITLRNGTISISLSNTYTQQGHMAFYKHGLGEKKLLFEEYDYVVWAHNPEEHIVSSRWITDFSHFELHLAAYDDEQFYGMGEKLYGPH